MAILNILMLMFSVSVRTPNQLPNPYDYELAAGVQAGKYGEAWGWYEREAGEMWTGVDLKAKYNIHAVEMSGFFQNRQAQNILRGGYSKSIVVFEYGRAGIASVWDHYDPALCARIGIDTPYFTCMTLLYEEGVESIAASAKYDIRISEWVVLAPTARYNLDRSRNEFMQGKLVLKVGKK